MFCKDSNREILFLKVSITNHMSAKDIADYIILVIKIYTYCFVSICYTSYITFSK